MREEDDGPWPSMPHDRIPRILGLQGLIKVLWYSADIGITTDTTSDISSTCVVLALVAGRQDCQPRPNSQQQTPLLLSQQLLSQRLYCP